MSNSTVTDSARGVAVRLLRWGLSDVVCVVALLALADLAFLVVETDAVVVRAALGAPLLAFLPGYVLVSALFPRSKLPGGGGPNARRGGGNGGDRTPNAASGRSARNRGSRSRGRDLRDAIGTPAQYCELSAGERLGLSVGTSVALLPLIALAIAATGRAYTTEVIVVALSAFVGIGALVGTVRRNRVPPESRYRVTVHEWIARVSRFCTRPDDSRRVALNVALVLAVVGSLAVAGFAFAAPQNGEEYTEFQLLAENESGDLVASGYPAEFEAGEERTMTTAVENRRGEATEYTVVVAVERVEREDESTSVVEQRELTSTSETVDPGERWREELSVGPEMVGEDLRLSYYLYEGEPPEDVGQDTADRHLYIWIDVAED